MVDPACQPEKEPSQKEMEVFQPSYARLRGSTYYPVKYGDYNKPFPNIPINHIGRAVNLRRCFFHLKKTTIESKLFCYPRDLSFPLTVVIDL